MVMRLALLSCWLGARGAALGIAAGRSEPTGRVPGGTSNAPSYLFGALWLIAAGETLLVR